MLKRLLSRKNALNERRVWGIWAPHGLRLAYKGMAAQLRVPMSVLVCHILAQWLTENGEAVLSSPEARQKYGDYLARKYLEGHDRTD